MSAQDDIVDTLGKMLWRVCTAPPDGCGFGPRRRTFTEDEVCDCGSPMRVAAVQAPPGKVRQAKAQAQKGVR